MSPIPETRRAPIQSTLIGLECGNCGLGHDSDRLQGLCTECQRPLLARYDLARAGRTLTLESLRSRRPDMWRYAEVMPSDHPVSLGEGLTPLHDVPRLASEVGVSTILIKDETTNPTGSFKARGISAAVTRARELGVERLAVPTAGNAGLALAAYAAAAGLRADIFCPADTPRPFQETVSILGGTLHPVDGFITDCAKQVLAGKEREGWFDVSTLKEPYRIEGKKTMGYELVEQLGGELPDVIIYPTGGGTGMVGMWKAFAEMEEMGWIGPDRPKMVSVQAAGCAPIVRAFETGSRHAEPWTDPHTYASGLRVPAAVGDFLILEAIRESGGCALVVDDREMAEQTREIGRTSGVLSAPEGGATLAAVRKLRERGDIDANDSVVLFVTGTALSYL